MNSLLKGAKEFREKDFPGYRDRFQCIAQKQTPHTLFITCCDSRVVPSLITKTMPGELFIIRNIANIVPYHHETSEYVSTTSAIEYAVNVLQVKNIIVCGHSDCGGCAALYNDDAVLKESVPHTQKWLELAYPVREKVIKKYPLSDEIRQELTEKENILQQVSNLKTYPNIQSRLKDGTMNIMGWYYSISEGIIMNYDFAAKQFVQV